MNTIKEFHAFFYWFLQLVLLYYRTMPWKLTGGILSLSLSKIFQVLAFFIPLKLFIIMSSQRMPHYMHFISETFSFNRDELVVLLSFSVGFFYILYVVLGILYRRIVDAHFQKLRLDDTTLGNVEISRRAMIKMHGRCIEAVSDFVLMVFSMIAVFFVNGWMALLWVLLLYTNIIFFFRKVFKNCQQNRISVLRLKHSQYINYISSANFLLIFSILVFQVMHTDLGLFSAIFLLLISRMLFRALSGYSVNSLYIYKNTV